MDQSNKKPLQRQEESENPQNLPDNLDVLSTIAECTEPSTSSGTDSDGVKHVKRPGGSSGTTRHNSLATHSPPESVIFNPKSHLFPSDEDELTLDDVYSPCTCLCFRKSKKCETPDKCKKKHDEDEKRRRY